MSPGDEIAAMARGWRMTSWPSRSNRHQTVPSPLGVQLVEVVAANLSILGSVPQDAASNHQQTMRGSDDRLADPMLARFAVEKRGEVTAEPRGGSISMREASICSRRRILRSTNSRSSITSRSIIR